MKIAVDAFGGDNAPLEIIKGAIDAKNEYGVDIALVGDCDTVKKCAEDNGIDLSGVELVDAEGVFDISEKRNLAQRVHRQVDFEVVVFVCYCLCLIFHESLQHLIDFALAFQ